MMFKNALVSVSDKTGLIEALRPLVTKGLRIVSTGGTAKALIAAGFPVTLVENQTGSPEVMDGRVKTLHPRVHMALLCRDGNAEDSKLMAQEGLSPFDLVIVNLYPFEQGILEKLDFADQIELIDIGGPSLLRAASKNFERISVFCDPKDYGLLAQKEGTNLEQRKYLAAKVFAHTSGYDALIANTLCPEIIKLGVPSFSTGIHSPLRYGENPHQQAIWLKDRSAKMGLHTAKVIQGKELSYNNILDIDAAHAALSEFIQEDETKSCTCVVVKHTNPCGIARGISVGEAIKSAIAADPQSAFGGILAVDRIVDAEACSAVGELFLECILAPDFTIEAQSYFSKKKNLRLLAWPDLRMQRPEFLMKSVAGGFLYQSVDQIENKENWEFAGIRPQDQTLQDMAFGICTVAHLKSNAIAVVLNGQTLGLGMGQVNRVDSVEQALSRAKKFHPDKNLQNAVLVSDAFFPFPDSIEIASRAGIRWIVQPGGSVRDKEVLARAKELGVEMVFTGRRHFLH